MERGRLQLGVIDRGVHTKSLERGYLSSSSALEAHYKYKGFVSSIWELNDQGMVETPNQFPIQSIFPEGLYIDSLDKLSD